MPCVGMEVWQEVLGTTCGWGGLVGLGSGAGFSASADIRVSVRSPSLSPLTRLGRYVILSAGPPPHWFGTENGYEPT